MKDHNEDFKSIVSSKEELVENAETDEESIIEELESIQERYDALEKNVEDTLKEHSDVNKAIVEVAKVKSMHAKLCNDIGRKLDSMELMPNEFENIKEKAEEIEVCLLIVTEQFFSSRKIHQSFFWQSPLIQRLFVPIFAMIFII